MTDQPDLFDRRRRALRRQRRAPQDWLGEQIAAALDDRLSLVNRQFERVLLIGARSSQMEAVLRQRAFNLDMLEPAGGSGLSADEDQLDVEPASYDLIVWPGGMESVNDVPGTLLRTRLALKPDGLLLGAAVGDGSFPALRIAIREGTTVTGRPPAARMMPQLTLQAIGDLLQRVGFALPVVDVEQFSLRYRHIDGLIRDLRGAALTSILAGPVPVLSRAEWTAIASSFAAQTTDDATIETVRIVHFSAWVPDPSQPKPARRGSATASLAAALQKGRQSGS